LGQGKHLWDTKLGIIPRNTGVKLAAASESPQKESSKDIRPAAFVIDAFSV
jgi:hypothetical protein